MYNWYRTYNCVVKMILVETVRAEIHCVWANCCILLFRVPPWQYIQTTRVPKGGFFLVSILHIHTILWQNFKENMTV